MNSEENIHANLVGLAVYYLTRFMAGVKGLDDKSIKTFSAYYLAMMK